MTQAVLAIWDALCLAAAAGMWYPLRTSSRRVQIVVALGGALVWGAAYEFADQGWSFTGRLVDGAVFPLALALPLLCTCATVLALVRPLPTSRTLPAVLSVLVVLSWGLMILARAVVGTPDLIGGLPDGNRYEMAVRGASFSSSLTVATRVWGSPPEFPLIEREIGWSAISRSDTDFPEREEFSVAPTLGDKRLLVSYGQDVIDEVPY